MSIPLIAIVLLFSAGLLTLGWWRQNAVLLFTINGVWWLGAAGSAYLVWLVWQERAYSENWAAMGFFFGTVPFAAVTGFLTLTELFFLRRWQGSSKKALRISALFFLAFLLAQIIVGLASI